jgi:hypothetical protein
LDDESQQIGFTETEIQKTHFRPVTGAKEERSVLARAVQPRFCRDLTQLTIDGKTFVTCNFH